MFDKKLGINWITLEMVYADKRYIENVYIWQKVNVRCFKNGTESICLSKGVRQVAHQHLLGWLNFKVEGVIIKVLKHANGEVLAANHD